MYPFQLLLIFFINFVSKLLQCMLLSTCLHKGEIPLAECSIPGNTPSVTLILVNKFKPNNFPLHKRDVAMVLLI